MRHLRALWAFVSLSFAPGVFASGMTLHIWMADIATEQYVQFPELQDLMQEQSAAYRSGSIFPDSGYAINHEYGEYAHWHKFLNAYYAVIEQRCPTMETVECRRVFAHFLGSLAHSVADVNFDRHFVTEVGNHDHGGDVDKAQTFTDPGCDFLAILEHKRGFKIPELKLPAEELLAAFQYGGEVQVTAEEMKRGTDIQRLGLVGEPLGSPFTYFYYKNNMKWGSKNYVDARGGVNDTARRIAHAWDLVWLRYNRKDGDGPLFNSTGPWPYVDFYVADQLLEDF